MHPTNTDVLLSLFTIMGIVTTAAGILYRRRRRAEAAAETQRIADHQRWMRQWADRPVPRDDSGRHHPPDQLLGGITYRLSPDRVGRAKVPRPQ